MPGDRGKRRLGIEVGMRTNPPVTVTPVLLALGTVCSFILYYYNIVLRLDPNPGL